MKFSDKPLTLEELERMYDESELVGLSVVIEVLGVKMAGIISRYENDGLCAFFAANGQLFKSVNYGKTWWVFPYVENEIDTEQWEPCELCYSEDILRLGISRNYYRFDISYGDSKALPNEQIRYCPHCGRPLTQEACEILEKRIRGEWT